MADRNTTEDTLYTIPIKIPRKKKKKAKKEFKKMFGFK